MSTLLTFETFVHAFAGASGSALSTCVFYPLDLAKTRLQVDTQTKDVQPVYQILSKIIREEGFSSLYTGFAPVVFSQYCSNFIYFYAFNGLRMLNRVKQLPFNQSISDLVVGMIAGSVNVVITTPLWVASTRLRLQGMKVLDYNRKLIDRKPYLNMWDCFRRIAKEEGVFSLWNSLGPSLMLVTNPAIQFMSYEAVKRYIRRNTGGVEISALTIFLMGAISKAIATVLTYPIQIVQARLRHNASVDDNSKRRRTVINIFREILRHEGFRGLFKGLETKLLQTVLSAALMFTIYEKIIAFVFWVTRIKK
ncbi:Peroxisomal membrane protein PMP34 [Trichoplax sp. H2]|uniref:Peroxisomal membrane protein PMP34 n=1 Tax=Trichoplax adhaerens TaxID=10228 RepID=B3RMX8_TRIAD|nr:hypothetical protein TRIADDRAFT_52964 [Trichoplax adhaerens]EDV27352.1 hypothetical protein TRIADDRAFT_52964 [Trichoplax adhaerens]RDD39858.1 Peroxisomal membrane protein PMP34 [Trichoplax sp. H2]|eukprot:XP_002109186.1 hypothetical protein TRIADDRAFT_52964 [Trichoplax adhaerens]